MVYTERVNGLCTDIKRCFHVLPVNDDGRKKYAEGKIK